MQKSISFLISNFHSLQLSSTLTRGHRKGGPTARSKNFKTPFLRDIQKSFQEITPMGPEPYQFFFFLKYLNKYGC